MPNAFAAWVKLPSIATPWKQRNLLKLMEFFELLTATFVLLRPISRPLLMRNPIQCIGFKNWTILGPISKFANYPRNETDCAELSAEVGQGDEHERNEARRPGP